MIPNDVNLTHALTTESAARAQNLKSGTVRNILFGSATVVGALGLGIAAVVWAATRGPDTEALKRFMVDLPPLTVSPIPALEVKPLTGTVSLAEGAVVGIDPDAVIRVEGGVGKGGASADPLIGGQPRTTIDGEAIKREVTVFNIVKFGEATIVTGWNYPSGSAKNPTTQFCYFLRMLPDGSQQKVEFAQNRVEVPGRLELVPNSGAAMSKCVWKS